VEGEELAGEGVGGEEAMVRREVEGDVEERCVGGGRADGGNGRLGPVSGGLGRGRDGREETEVLLAAEEVETARPGACPDSGNKPTYTQDVLFTGIVTI
jgi:hypothetical protein